MTRIEYRVVYMRGGSRQYRDGFPKKDIVWGSYLHDIRPYEVIGWQSRTISDWKDDNG